MDLKKRLLLAGLQPAAREAIPPPEDRYPPLDSLVGGAWIEACGGMCLVTEHRYPLEHSHGGQKLGDLASVPDGEWAPFIGGAPTFDLAKAAFIDTETTGLARGAGTYAFLVGVGGFEDDQFVLRQYFMPDFGHEEALLDLLAINLDARHGIVSFNGRSFDWPILEARYAMARRDPPSVQPPHLDLLPLSRRLWRRILPSCALGSLERYVLGLERRADDVPGYLIPQLYLDYVRYGNTRSMERVFYHNAMDVISMVSLATKAGLLLSARRAEIDDPLCDHVALGRLYERLGRETTAESVYRLAIDRAEDGESCALACKYLAFLYKRQARYLEAMDLWRKQLHGRELYPYIEMAKIYEHRWRDYTAAKEMVTAAMSWLQSHAAELGRGECASIQRELAHRLSRLERRIRGLSDVAAASGSPQ